jgi:transposase
MATEPKDPPKITSALGPDLDAVGRFIREMIAAGAIVTLIQAVVALLARMRDLNTDLLSKLAQQRRKHPASETLRRLQQEQLPLFGRRTGDADTKADGDPKPGEPRKKRNKRGPLHADKHGRGKPPEHLPRRVEEHRVSDDQRACPCCGAPMTTVGFKCCEKLDVVPAHFIVVEVRREVVACSDSDCHEHMATAPKPDEIVDRGKLGDELLVQALVDHYRDGVPWERMARNAREQGVTLPANRLAASVWRAIDLLDPVVRHITHKTLTSNYVAFDATGLPVLDDKHPLGIRAGAMWGLIGDGRWATFFPAPSGHDDHLQKRLAGYTLALAMCDGSPTNNVAEGPTTKRGGCNAHARRGAVEALRRGDERAIEAIEIYAEIFAVDATSKRLGESAEQRLERRQRESTPLVEKLRVWVDARLDDVEPKSALGKAVRYLRNQWSRLTLFLTEAAMELTNNAAERLLRTLVLDRKSWLFVGSDQSAQRTADALTILMTCRALEIEPRRYLRDTLRRILDGVTDLASLLPENYVPLAATPR